VGHFDNFDRLNPDRWFSRAFSSLMYDKEAAFGSELKFEAGLAPRASYFSLRAQRKVTKRKGTRMAR
jgi:DNA primase catalytic subunit